MVISNWSIRQSVTVWVAALLITLGGAMAYMSLPREAAPDVTIPFLMVTTPYFGVSPADIESLVTNPIEDELEQLKDVREIRSTSAEGASIISIEFEPDVDIDDALQKVRARVNAAEPELPPDAEDPILTEISFSEWPVLIINISGDVGLLRLKQIAEQLQDRIERIPGVLDAALTGGIQREIRVEADPERMQHYGVDLNELTWAIQRTNLNMPGGSMDMGDLKFLVRVPGEFEEAHEILDIVVKEEGGQPIFVRDVATVIDGYQDQATYSRLNGRPSVSLSITRRAGENIIRITDEAKAAVAEFRAELGDTIVFTELADASKDIRSQLSDLENNMASGFILVLAVLLFLMGGLRNALVVAVAIPMSMLLSFLVLDAMDVTLNMVVLFSLVLALGMLVDNAIVVVENIYRHGMMGKPRVRAAMDGTGEVAWPIISSTATTVAAFFPLLFWPGIMGEFMYYLPLTVVVVLTSSLVVALTVSPVIGAALIRAKTSTKPDGSPLEEHDAIPRNIIYRVYEFVLRLALRHRTLFLVGVAGVFVGTFVYYGGHQNGVEFFPGTTPERFNVNVTLPDGSNVEASDRVVRLVEDILDDQQNIANWVADVGGGNGNQMDFGAGGSAPHRSRITVDLRDAAEQVESPYVTIDRIRRALLEIPGADFEIVEEENGPPSGAPVSIELVGPDFDRLGEISEELTRLVRETPGLVDLRDNFEAGRSEITVRVDREAAALVGTNTQAVANTIRMAVNGMEVSHLRDGADEYDIIVRMADPWREDVNDIRALLISLEEGRRVRLSEVARVELGRGFGSIRHVDGERVVTISGDVAEGFNDFAVLAAVQERISDGYHVPAGYALRYTGQNQDQEESQAFLSRALMWAMFLIGIILITQFNSVIQTLIIVSSVVLSLIGVLWTLLIRGEPFNIIMTGIAIISLAGVAVNNAIVLIDYINVLKARGMHVFEACVLGGMVRLRPVMLTTITTILGLLPTVFGASIDFRSLSITWGGRSVEMWGPMSAAVAGGLTVTTFLTLVVVPVLYSVTDSFRGWWERITSPARDRMPGSAPAALLALLIVGPTPLWLPRPATAQPRGEVLTLEAAVETALANSRDVQISELAIDQAELLDVQARAVLMPIANLNATYTFNDQEVEFTQSNPYAPLSPYLDSVWENDPELQQYLADNPGVPDARALAGATFDPMIVQVRHDYRVVGTLSQTIFNARAFPALRLARAIQAQARNGQEQAEWEVAGAVQQVYFTAVALRRVIDVAERNVELSALSLESAEAALSEEVGTRWTVDRATISLDLARRDVESARLGYSLAVESLALLLGRDGNFDVEAPPALGLPADAETLVDQALRSQPRVVGADLLLAYDEVRNDEVRSRWWPTIVADLTTMYQRESAFGGDPFRWSIGLTANWLLYDGGIRGMERNDRELVEQQDRLRREQLLDSIESEIRQARLRIDAQSERAESARQSAELARTNVDRTREAFELGVATRLDVELAQQQAYLAELALVSAETELQAALYRLRHLTGE